MSLAVAVRAHDGIAVAADTLTTVTSRPAEEGAVSVSYPATESASKVFRFLETYGVSVVGNSVIAGRSVAAILGELQVEMATEDITVEELTVRKVGERIGNYIRSLLVASKEDAGAAVTLLCSGFNNTLDAPPTTMEVTVRDGKMVIPSDSPHEVRGVTVSGEGYVVEALWAMAKARNAAPGLDYFSLRDAAAYARFLIEITRDFQRFHMVPQAVGGGVDIALIERRRGFRWLRADSRPHMTK
ncbi:MAG: hypothetical protein OXU74_09425 [Gemmatimonadota bacterium]|nr:hypothetical protein [Gemmatimonadota bacterium]